MLDIKFIRDNTGLVSDAARKKRIAFDLNKLLEADDKRRAILGDVEKMRAEQNTATDEIAQAKDEKDRSAMIEKMRVFKEKLKTKEEELEWVMKEWRALMLQVPNIPDVSVPDGESDADNKEVKVWGEKPKFSFKPESHIALMENLGLVNLPRGVKVAGFRGYFLEGDGALLSFALWQFAYKHFLEKGAFVPILAPSLVRKEAFLGTGYLPQGEDDLYKTQDGEYLAGTSEVALMGYYMNEIIPKEDLPKKLLGFSPCFRREAGSHGKDTKGIFRVHEFYKFEQVVLCEANHQESVKEHEWMNRNTEEFIEALGIPYRTVINCGADLGLGQVKKYDIELWVPSEEKYREISSASYFHDFQTRRLNIRYRDSHGVLHFAHSLNSTAIATPRVLVALIENNQQEDGSVIIPKVLEPYFGKSILSKNSS